MAGGYMGKVLFVDLSKDELKGEALDEKLCREFMGGYGIGARIIYSRQKAGVDPLGPENILGFMTGPLTGTATPFGSRYGVVVGKSPLTGGWGDANSGGDFGPYLKFAGYDGVFFTGVSEKPVYLFIKDGKAELRDATHLWGKGVDETEDMLKAELGKEVRVASIGPAGEKLSLISAIINNKGRAAGRSGVGAVMGSKKLKAIAVIGTAKIPVANSEEVNKLRKKYMADMKGPIVDSMRKFGTSGGTAIWAHNGDTPVKNWGGVGMRDFPNPSLISGENVIKYEEKRYGCYRCPISCGAHMKAGKGEYKYKAGADRPEYETMGMFGPNCLNDNVESIIMANDICNRCGLDTISTAATIAFAIECYENGVITKEDTDGIEMTWGNHRAIVAMTEKIAKRESFGAMLADGVKVAAERIGRGADKYAIHVHGQELPAHDPKLRPAYATAYQSDPTPGRHTQEGLECTEKGFVPAGLELPSLDKYTYTGKGKSEALFRNKNHLFNASGVCQFSTYFLPWDTMDKFLSLVTGWQLSPEEITTMCERISAMRQAFNLREGLSHKDFKLPGRAIGEPPLKEGPVANITVDVDTLVSEYYKALDWDAETGKPSQKRLQELGLEDVAKDLWP